MESNVGYTFLVIYLLYMLHLVYDIRERLLLGQKTKTMGGEQSLADFLVSICSDDVDKAVNTYKTATGCDAEEAKEFVHSLRKRLSERHSM
ncbi:hypothetical protein WH43_03625 [Rheinheimera sp. KL1]|jgi:hypothetical protein|uniref:hypothetical protein n=1 Tax=Rheinheimera sp. KL1 TaxID=1635005 RepID=UPI0006A9B7F6|nr:hypothetical protein [Rheinheimera sp. KL1]KOO59346.1 hypothetical protein WH43_03625 [Rheinheimera sp. KL1]